MTAIVTKARPAIVAPANGIIALKGANKSAREMAFVKIAPLSLVESLSRAECVANLRMALGKAPNQLELSTARDEHIIGKVALKLAGKDNSDRLEKARDVVLHYATDKAKKVAKSQKGRRTPDQQRAYQAGKEQFSQLLASLNLGSAQTPEQRNAGRTRKPAPAGSTKRAKAGQSEAPGKVVRMDRELACQHVVGQAAALLAFSNKYAKLLPGDFGSAIQRFKADINAAMNAEQERNAKPTK
jgi:hypothetical protein